MTKNPNKVQFFENSPIRSVWDEKTEEWYFSVVDICGALTGAENPRRYWSDLKRKMKSEGSELYENIVQLKLESADGKKYLTDVATTEQLLRIIQSIPSKKAEPIKLWLAEVGKDRIEETIDPEKIAERLVRTYERRGYTKEWINQRLESISARKDLTDEWRAAGIKSGKEYALLTDELTKTWSGMTTREYKNFKGLKKESLRDNMSTTELILNMLAETATKDIAHKENPKGFEENKKTTRRGGGVAKLAREALEKEIAEPVVTSKTALDLNHTVLRTTETSAKLSANTSENPSK
ncbi:Bro-N domain-containing protein [Candidatus Saccharibacteria bacterium]|nr:Bro-N domain-containing protein [Candidatus Saccharibacteria bacterium]